MNIAELDQTITELSKKAKLDAWNAFVEELKVPSELYPALATNRVELIKLARPRPLTTEETAALYTLIGALIETNMALREHASQVANLVQDWTSSLQGAMTSARKIRYFANFRHTEAAPENDME